MTGPNRRQLLLGGLAASAVGALSACGADARPASVGLPTPLPPARRPAVVRTLTARESRIDLGGPVVDTWAYDGTVPGPEIRARAGDYLQVTVKNQLPTETTVHWHGIALNNAADGVPGMTQNPVGAGQDYSYTFLAPDPGTYFFHPHVGVQLDRGLYAPLIIEDPHEPGGYDHEWVVVLDDWVDGTGRTPDEVLASLTGSSGSGMGGMSGMSGMGGMGGGSGPFGDAGDVQYPYYLINGRVPSAPQTFTAKPGQKVRIRLINAASDTIFAVALGGHTLRVTHTDGYPVTPRTVGALYLAMGERYDVTVTLGDGVAPLVAQPVGKSGLARALVRTGSGASPAADLVPVELGGPILMGADLLPADQSLLPARSPDATIDVALTGQMMPYAWGVNGAPYGKNEPLLVSAGDRVRVLASNRTMMTHPLHLHGHTFALASSGLRKDTVILRPMESRVLELQADNPGRWAVHCHNAYHAEAGMMAELRYRA